VFKYLNSCLALAALGWGTAACAGTVTTTANATFSVASGCSVSGNTVDLGTYSSLETLQDVGDQLGYQKSTTNAIIRGVNAPGAVTYGEISCDEGVPYTLGITGTEPTVGDAKLDLAAGSIYFQLMVKQIGEMMVPDGNAEQNGFGRSANPYWHGGKGIGATGDGKSQPIKGNVIPVVFDAKVNPPYLAASEQLGAPGGYTAAFLNTINF